MTLVSADIADLMQRIAALNLQVHRLHLPRKPWEKRRAACRCIFNGRDEAACDTTLGDLGSNHAAMVSLSLRRERDILLADLHARILAMPCLFPEATFLSLTFGHTKAAGPAISIKIDGMEVHPRPVTPA